MAHRTSVLKFGTAGASQEFTVSNGRLQPLEAKPFTFELREEEDYGLASRKGAVALPVGFSVEALSESKSLPILPTTTARTSAVRVPNTASSRQSYGKGSQIVLDNLLQSGVGPEPSAQAGFSGDTPSRRNTALRSSNFKSTSIREEKKALETKLNKVAAQSSKTPDEPAAQRSMLVHRALLSTVKSQDNQDVKRLTKQIRKSQFAKMRDPTKSTAAQLMSMEDTQRDMTLEEYEGVSPVLYSEAAGRGRQQRTSIFGTLRHNSHNRRASRISPEELKAATETHEEALPGDTDDILPPPTQKLVKMMNRALILLSNTSVLRTVEEAKGIAGCFEELPLFQNLDRDTRVQICRHITYEHCHASQDVVCEGEFCDRMLVLLKGYLNVKPQGTAERESEEGAMVNVPLRSVGPGTTFGQQAMIEQKVFTNSVQVSRVGGAHVAVFPRDQYLQCTRCALGSAALRAVSALSHLSDDTREKIASAMRHLIVDPGEPIFLQGSVGDTFYVIVRGEVWITMKDTFALNLREATGKVSFKNLAKKVEEVQKGVNEFQVKNNHKAPGSPDKEKKADPGKPAPASHASAGPAEHRNSVVHKDIKDLAKEVQQDVDNMNVKIAATPLPNKPVFKELGGLPKPTPLNSKAVPEDAPADQDTQAVDKDTQPARGEQGKESEDSVGALGMPDRKPNRRAGRRETVILQGGNRRQSISGGPGRKQSVTGGIGGRRVSIARKQSVIAPPRQAVLVPDGTGGWKVSNVVEGSLREAEASGQEEDPSSPAQPTLHLKRSVPVDMRKEASAADDKGEEDTEQEETATVNMFMSEEQAARAKVKCGIPRGDRLVRKMGPGDSFGELALLKNNLRSASVYAATQTELLTLDRKSYLYLMEQATVERTGGQNKVPTMRDARRVLNKFSVERSYEDVDMLARFMGDLPLFSKLQWQLRIDLCQCLEREVVPANRVVFLQGDPGDKYYVILSGCVRIDVRFENPRDGTSGYKTIKRLGPGDQFGEMALLRGGLRNATATAENDSEFAVLDKRNYTRIMRAEDLSRMAVTADFLQGCYGFTGWPRSSILRVAYVIHAEERKKGDELIRQGDKCREVFFIRSGQVKLVYQLDAVIRQTLGPDLGDATIHQLKTIKDLSFFGSKEGINFDVAMLGKHDTVGDLAAIDGTPQQVSATCNTQCELFSIISQEYVNRVSNFDLAFRQQAVKRDTHYLERAARGVSAILQVSSHLNNTEGITLRKNIERVVRALDGTTAPLQDATPAPPPAPQPMNIHLIGGSRCDPVMGSWEEHQEDRKFQRVQDRMNDMVDSMGVVEGPQGVLAIHHNPRRAGPAHAGPISPQEPKPVLREEVLQTIAQVGHERATTIPVVTRPGFEKLSNLSDTRVDSSLSKYSVADPLSRPQSVQISDVLSQYVDSAMKQGTRNPSARSASTAASTRRDVQAYPSSAALPPPSTQRTRPTPASAQSGVGIPPARADSFSSKSLRFRHISSSSPLPPARKLEGDLQQSAATPQGAGSPLPSQPSSTPLSRQSLGGLRAEASEPSRLGAPSPTPAPSTTHRWQAAGSSINKRMLAIDRDLQRDIQTNQLNFVGGRARSALLSTGSDEGEAPLDSDASDDEGEDRFAGDERLASLSFNKGKNSHMDVRLGALANTVEQYDGSLLPEKMRCSSPSANRRRSMMMIFADEKDKEQKRLEKAPLTPMPMWKRLLFDAEHEQDEVFEEHTAMPSFHSKRGFGTGYAEGGVLYF